MYDLFVLSLLSLILVTNSSWREYCGEYCDTLQVGSLTNFKKLGYEIYEKYDWEDQGSFSKKLCMKWYTSLKE